MSDHGQGQGQGGDQVTRDEEAGGSVWSKPTAKPEPGSRPSGSPPGSPDFNRWFTHPGGSASEAGERIHAYIEQQVRRDALQREGQVFTWLREHWPWYLRWAIGYPRAIAALDRLGLVVLPVFVAGHAIGEVPQPLKTSTIDQMVQVYGYDVKLNGGLWALGPDGQRIDVPLTPGMIDGHACLILDPGPVAEAINEWELRDRPEGKTCRQG